MTEKNTRKVQLQLKKLNLRWRIRLNNRKALPISLIAVIQSVEIVGDSNHVETKTMKKKNEIKMFIKMHEMHNISRLMPASIENCH